MSYVSKTLHQDGVVRELSAEEIEIAAGGVDHALKFEFSTTTGTDGKTSATAKVVWEIKF